MNSKRTRFLLIAISLVVLGGAHQNLAAQPGPGHVVACFYECVPDSTGRVWKETTGLVIPNPSGGETVYSSVLWFYDGNEQFLHTAQTFLSEYDLDTINVCETLDAVGMVPRSGVIYIEHQPSSSGILDDEDFTPAAGWVKNYIGSFQRATSLSTRTSVTPAFVHEPANGVLKSIGKTGCQTIFKEAPASVDGAPIDLIYIEGTEDPIT